jgi:hypothetical protein
MDAIELTEKMKPYAVAICKQSNGGNPKAKAVINLHRMLCAKAEHVALALCEEAFNDWLISQQP